MPQSALGIFDADNRYYDPRDAFTRHLDPRLKERAVRVETDARGKDTIFVAGVKHHFTPPTFELAEPAAYPSYLPEGMSDAAIRAMMRDNGRALLGLR